MSCFSLFCKYCQELILKSCGLCDCDNSVKDFSGTCDRCVDNKVVDSSKEE